MSDLSCLFLGDSITDAGHLWGKDSRMLGDGYIRIISEHPAFADARLINKGQDGFTSADLLRLVKRLFPGTFDCITVLIGVNDLPVAFYADPDWISERFSRNIRAILEALREHHEGRLLVMEPFLFAPPAEHLHLMPLLDRERDLLRAAAEDFSGEYVALQAVLDEAAKQQGLSAVTTDGIHLTEAGNRILAEQWIRQLLSPMR